MAVLTSLNGDANLASLGRLFHILAPQKKNAFCSCRVFFFGNLTLVFVLRKLQEGQALFLLNRIYRYCGARFFRDL